MPNARTVEELMVEEMEQRQREQRERTLEQARERYTSIADNPTNYPHAGADIEATAEMDNEESDAHFIERQRRLQERHEREQARATRPHRTPRERGLYLPENCRRSVARATDNTVCVHCGTHFDSFEEGMTLDGSDICGRCHTAYSRCQDCENVVHLEELFITRSLQGNGRRVCDNCRNGNYIYCQHCNGLWNEQSMTHVPNRERGLIEYFCPHCPTNPTSTEMPRVSLTETHTASGRREFAKHKGWCDGQKGKNVDSKRIWSAEIECITPRGDFSESAFGRSIPKEIGISGDGSLSSGGIEIQTPMLQGEKGESLLKHLCKRLKETGFTTDISCGMHIHLDKGSVLIPSNPISQEPNALKNLWGFLLAFEDAILSVLPPSRRTNRYCRKMRKYFHLQEIRNCSSLDGLEKVWYRCISRMEIENRKSGKYDDSRYTGFNFHSLFGHGHLEIRYHSGTISYKKITEWANLFCKIMDWADQPGASWSLIEQADEMLDVADKRKFMYQVLGISAESQAYFESRAAHFKIGNSEETLTASE